MSLEGTALKFAGGLVVSAFVALSGVVWSNHTDNSTQEVRLQYLETMLTAVEELNDTLVITNQSVAILNVKLAVLKEELADVEDAINESE